MMDTSHMEMAAKTKPERDIETMACQEMETRPEEEKPASVDMKPEAAQQEEVPKEDAEVMPVGELRNKRHKDRKLAAECRHQMKERTQDGCQRTLAAARRGTSHRAEVARKMQADKRMPRYATVARHMRDIFNKHPPSTGVSPCHAE
jgi:hypothetical protein